MSYASIRSIGDESCPPCTFLFGGDCQLCPEGADLPECAGCVGGARPNWSDSFWGTVAIGAATTIAVTVASAMVMRSLRVKG